MKSFFSMTRALVARKRKIFALFFALAASVGMMNAKVTWKSSNISDLNVHGTYQSYSKEGVTLSANSDMNDAMWYNYGDESQHGISFNAHQTGGFTFSNTLGKNFTKIEMTLNGPGIWDMANLGSGWSFFWEPSEDNHATVTWTGNASTVDLLKEASDFPGGEPVKSIVFYFVGDSEEPDPTYTVALQDGTANADKVTLSATSVVEGATVTVTPNEEYEITAFSATYNTTEELSTSFNAETGAYSFTMPAYDVTIEATIALKPVPEGDVFAGFTATAGSGGFDNEGHANLVDGKFTSGNVQTDWTKWCTNNDHRSVPTGESGDACWWIDFEASAALDLTGYILTTGNDTGNEHGRNPKNWVLKAKLNADDAWTTIATVTNDVTMKNQSFKDYKFFVDQSGPYKYFRFEVFANQGAGVMQLCELRLIGTEAPGGGWVAGIPCTAADLGKVLCTDGSIYTTVSDATAANKTAVAMIAYIDTENNKGLALALVEEKGNANWSEAIAKCAAKTPTITGGTWKLASEDEWNKIIDAVGGRNALRDGFSAIGGSNLKSDGNDKYWSSTESSNTEKGRCICFNNTFGGWSDASKTTNYPFYARACLAFNIGEQFPPYEAAMNLINEIPNPAVLTAECKAKIDAARAAFNALSDGDKAQVTNIATLTTAEAAFDNVMDIWLSGDCDVILWSDTTLTVRKHAGEGNGAMADYNYASRAPWYSGHWYNPQPNDIVIKSVTIEEGVTHLGDYAFAWMSEMKTATIPSSVTTIPKDAFYWSKAVDDIYLTVADPSNLTWALPNTADVQFKPEKATLCHVPADLLTAYQEKFGTLNMTFVGDLDPITPLTPEQQQALDAAKGLINAIPSPVVYTPACKDAIDDARAAYDALKPDMLKQLVSNYATLTAAEATYESLKDVVVVEAKINEIPSPMTAENTKLSVYQKVQDARAAYDALTAEQKALVSNYSRLTDAEEAFAPYTSGISSDYANDFSTEALQNEFVIIDANKDGKTWVPIKDNGDMRYNYGQIPADDWLVSPMIKLKAGNVYKVSLQARAMSNSYPERLEVKAAKEATAAGADTVALLAAGKEVIAATTIKTPGYIPLANEAFMVEETGNYNFGIHAISDADVYWLFADDFAVELVSGNPPSLLDEAQAALDLINAIPQPVVYTPECSAAIKAAREAVDALGANASLLDDADINKLTQAEAAYAELLAQAVAPVIAAINAVPATPLTDATAKLSEYNKVLAAREAYDALATDEEKAAVTNYDKLTAAEAAFAAIDKGGSSVYDSGSVALTDLRIGDVLKAGVTLTGETTDVVGLQRLARNGEKTDGQFTISFQYMTHLLGENAAITSGSMVLTPIAEDGNAGDAWIVFDGSAIAEATVWLNGISSAALPSIIADARAAVALIHAIPDSVVYTDACKATIDTARAAVTALGSNASLIDDEDMAILTAAEARYNYLNNRPTPSFNPAPAATNHIYNGTAQALVTAGVPDYGTILYSIGGEDYSEAVPTAVNYGYYPVYYKILETEENKAFGPVQITAPILKAAPVFTVPTAKNRTYDGTRQQLVTEGSSNDGNLAYSLNPEEDEWVAYGPYAKEAGIYKVYYKLVADDNHTDSVASEPITVTIAKVALTATADDKSVTYGDPVPAYTVTYAGWVNGENESVLTGEIAYVCEYTASSDAAEYDITPSGVSAANYEITFVNGKLTVNKADAVFTAPQAVSGLVYTSEKQALISAGECADGTFLYSLDNTNWADTVPMVTNAATYTVYYKVQGDANHNDYIAAEPIEVSVAKAALTITAENKEVVYGYAAPGFSVSYSGLKGSDLPADVLTGELAYACDYTAGSNAGEYDITPSGQTSANYDITYVNGKLVVYKADPAFTAPTADTLTYNGGVQTLIAAGTTEHGTFEYTFTPNDDESWNTALPQAKNADTYGVYYRIVGDANHNDYESADAVVVTIAQAALTATADDKSVIYGDDAPEYTVTYEGWQGEDNADVLSGTIAYACEYAPTSNVGEYDIVPSGVSNPDYAITFVNGKVTVSKAQLTITADNKEVTYGDEAPAFTVTYEGFKNEDDEIVVSGLTLTSEYVQTSNVGEYAIVPADATAQNYAITFVNGTLTVNRAALMITAEDKEVTYGDEDPAFTASYEGWKNADDESVVSGLTLTSEYVQTSNVGEYDIVPANATAQNYAISYTNGTLTVNKAPLMITAEDKEVTYGDEAPAFTASYEGWKNADDESVVSGLTLTSEYVQTSNVGEYDIVPANATAQNYAISYTNGTLTVNQAALTITAEDKTMFYGDEAPEFTVTYAGWKNEDDEAVVSGLNYTCAYAPGSYIGTYVINPNSATAQNYAITFVDGTLTVNKATVKVTGADIQEAKFEDGNTAAVVLNAGQLEGIKLNDPIGHVTTATFSDATVGEGKTITMFYELTGDAALLTNYNLTPTSEIFAKEGTIIENFIPNDNPEEKVDDETEVKEGIEVYAYGYCLGDSVGMSYHLNSGNPDQYKIDFDDSRFTDVDWTDLDITGPDGIIYIEVPVAVPTGDYQMTVTFRDSRFTWLPSNPMSVTFHVNLPETYVMPMFDNTIALVDTCECFTDIQWYHRTDASEAWVAIPGATGHYYRPADGSKLTGEFFVQAKMNGVPTYTCGQADMETLYGAEKPKANVKAFPNPVVNTTVVTIENSENYEHSLRIVDLTGAEMFRTTFEGNETKVDMDGFVQGNYMISVDGIVVKVMKK